MVWPKFRAILTDVTLSKWTETGGPPVIEAERVEIDLSAMAALRGDVVFSSARLVRPTIRVERAADGSYRPGMPTGGRIARSIDVARKLVEKEPTNPDVEQVSGRSLRDRRIQGRTDGDVPSTARKSKS